MFGALATLAERVVVDAAAARDKPQRLSLEARAENQIGVSVGDHSTGCRR